MSLGRTIPILRILDERKAKEFYLEFLGFTLDWEHRFEPGLPLYLQVSKMAPLSICLNITAIVAPAQPFASRPTGLMPCINDF
jgi:hypothetical protein